MGFKFINIILKLLVIMINKRYTCNVKCSSITWLLVALYINVYCDINKKTYFTYVTISPAYKKFLYIKNGIMHNFHCKRGAVIAIYFRRLTYIITQIWQCCLLKLKYENCQNIISCIKVNLSIFIFMLQFCWNNILRLN